MSLLQAECDIRGSYEPPPQKKEVHVKMFLYGAQLLEGPGMESI